MIPPIIRAISSTRSAFDKRRTLVCVLPFDSRLVDHEVSVRQRRDLREVRDADHLTMPRDVRDGPPDHFGHGPADARIDFVEHVRADGALVRQHPLEREQGPRELAAAGDLAKRPGLFAGVGRDQKLDAIDPGTREASPVDEQRGAPWQSRA